MRWLRRAAWALLAAVVLFVSAVVSVGWRLSGPRWTGPPTDHFDGQRFRNRREVPHGGFVDFLRWQLSRDAGPWDELRDRPPGPPPPRRVARGAARVTFVNHATALVQVDGINLLTDPIWSERASPFSWVGPRRRAPPGLRFDDLPPIDAVVISHNHYDHCDLPTLERIARRHAARFFVGLGNAPLLRAAGIARVEELDWWQSVRLSEEVELFAVPAQHFSNRGLFDRDQTLWAGWALKGPGGVAYYAGDTGAGPHFAEIRARLGPPRLALLPIGAYRPRWFMEGVHVDPAQAVEAAVALGAGTSVAVHFGTFRLADDGQDEPARELATALAERGEKAPRFWVLGGGEGREVP